MINNKFRHELKYTINYHTYCILKSRLSKVMELDKYSNENGEYIISSLYLDDINNKALAEKLSGIHDRYKYRIRCYNDSGDVLLLEKKIKKSNYVNKKKAVINKETYCEILNNNYSNLINSEKELVKELGQKMQKSILKPKVIVRYTREAYVEVNGNVRITFDKDLRTGLNKIDMLDPNTIFIKTIEEDLMILEIKFDEYLPEYIRCLLQVEGLTQQSLSKYVMCRKHNKYNTWEEN